MDNRIHLAIPAVGDWRQRAEITARSAIRGSSLPVCVHYLDWTNVDREKMERLGSWHGSAIAWSRMFLDEILPQDVDWVISADADVLFCGDIAELWKLRDERYLAMGSVDSPPPWQAHDPNDFCTGLSMFNLRRWRTEGWSAKLADWLAENPHETFIDQVALNRVFAEVKTLLPRPWGCFSGDANIGIDYDGNCAIHFVADPPWTRGKLTQLMSDAVVRWRQEAGLPYGGWRRWLYCLLRATRGIWGWLPWFGWHFRSAKHR